MSDEVRLHEFTKEEWADVYFRFYPNDTQEEYELAWEAFQKFKADCLIKLQRQ
jgi:hypothetical protein